MNHPIRVVSERTGLSTHAIRVWERRYGAVKPVRSETNRRLYSDADIERLQLLQRAIRRGRSIGQIATLPTEELLDLVAEDEGHARDQTAKAEASSVNEHETVSDCIDAIESLDTQALEQALSRAAVAFSKPVLLQSVLIPLLQRIGDQWRDGTLRVAHEHLASAVIRTFLGSLSQAYAPANGGPGIVVTTPSGQLHEIGALMVADVASSEGWRVAYLGPNLPAEDIAAAAQQHSAIAIAVSVVYPADDPGLRRELLKLRRYLPPEISILIGGRAAHGYTEVVEEIQAIRLKDLSDLRTELEKLRMKKTLADAEELP